MTRRLSAAEHRTVDPVVAAAALDVDPIAAEVEAAVIKRFTDLPAGLRSAASLELMNEIGRTLHAGIAAGLRKVERDARQADG